MLVINIRFQLQTRAEKEEEMREKLRTFDVSVMETEIKAMVSGGYELSQKVVFQCVARDEKSLKELLRYLDHDYKSVALITF